MNKQKYDILETILKETYINQRSIAELTGYSLGKVNTAVRDLQENGYLSPDMQPTVKCKEEILEKNRAMQLFWRRESGCVWFR